MLLLREGKRKGEEEERGRSGQREVASLLLEGWTPLPTGVGGQRRGMREGREGEGAARKILRIKSNQSKIV